MKYLSLFIPLLLLIYLNTWFDQRLRLKEIVHRTLGA